MKFVPIAGKWPFCGSTSGDMSIKRTDGDGHKLTASERNYCDECGVFGSFCHMTCEDVSTSKPVLLCRGCYELYLPMVALALVAGA